MLHTKSSRSALVQDTVRRVGDDLDDTIAASKRGREVDVVAAEAAESGLLDGWTKIGPFGGCGQSA